MRHYCAAALLLGFCEYASASTLTYTDQRNDGMFATAPYQLTADNSKTITSDAFGPSDSGTNTSNSETGDTPHMLIPNDSTLLTLAAGTTLTSAIYDLSYTFDVTAPRNVTDNSGTNRAQTDPVFTAENQNLTVFLIFQDMNGTNLKKVNVTSLSGDLDILPYLLGTAPGSSDVAAALNSTGITIKTNFSVDGVVFSADLSGYDPANNPDRNVTINYNVTEKLNSNSSVTLVESSGVPEPGSFALLGLGLAALAGFGRKVRR